MWCVGVGVDRRLPYLDAEGMVRGQSTATSTVYGFAGIDPETVGATSRICAAT